MDESEKIQKSIALIKKLSEKVDRCDWEKTKDVPVSAQNYKGEKFELRLPSGSIIIGMEDLYIYNRIGECISHCKDTDGIRSALVILWGKVGQKIQSPIDAQIISIIEELDKL